MKVYKIRNVFQLNCYQSEQIKSKFISKTLIAILLFLIQCSTVVSAAVTYSPVTNPLVTAGASNGYSGGEESLPIDLDSDGDIDFIAFDASDVLRLYRNNGSGVFTPENLGFTPTVGNMYGSVVADIDNDGDDDLLDQDNIYRRNDAGTLVSATNPLVTAGASNGYSGGANNKPIDIDSDGDIDFIAFDASDVLRLYRNNGSGSFTQENLGFTPTVGNMYGSVVADIDNDGDDDVLDEDNVYRRNDAGTLVSATNPLVTAGASNGYSGGENNKPIDIDSDGDIDFIAFDASDVLRLYRNNGSGSFTQENLGFTPSVGNMYGTVVADIDNDGDDDVIDEDNVFQQASGKPPELPTTSPVDNATNIDVNTNIVLTFDETITSAGTGAINIYKVSDDSLVESIAGNSISVTGVGTITITINPAVTLDAATEYYFQINKKAFFDSDDSTYNHRSVLDKTSHSFTTGTSNTAPVLGGTFNTAGTVDDNATLAPFSAVTVTDGDGDNVSIHITFTGANGSLSGTGLTTNGSGDYTVDSAVAATAQSNLQGLTFTPTENQSATDTITTFTLTPNDGTSDGTADSTTQITASPVLPTISSVSVPANATYILGENLDFSVNTSESIIVSNTPRLTLTIGGITKYANYLSGTGTTSLVFRYTVESGLTDADGIVIAGSIDLNTTGVFNDFGGSVMGTTLNSVGATTLILVDSTVPTANFTAATDDVGTVTGTLSSGDTTDDTALILSGTNESGSTVNVYNGVTLLGTATVSGTSWSFNATVANGITYQFNVTETDTVGNTSTATSNFTVIGDTAAPTANLSAATDNVGTVTGTLSSGDTTDDTALVLSGSNENGATVSVYNGGALLGAATVSGTGWSYTVAVANGTTYQFNVQETDAAGNTSPATANFSVTGDTLAPTASFTAATDDAGTITGTLSSGDTTDDTALVLSGTNENGATVNVYNGVALLGAATVSGTGWSYSATIANGTTYQFNVQETDAAGNSSAATSNFTVIGDTVAPTANFTAATDDVGTVTGALSSGDTTDDTALALTGTNENGSTVNVYDGVVLLGAATVSGTSWSYTATVANGTTYQFNVTETDTVGNTSAVTSNFTVIGDTVAPTANLSAATDNVGTVTGTLSSGDTTDDTALVLSGSNENGATVSVYNGGALLGAATVSGTGWSYTAAVANGTTYQFNVQETDAAGNTSPATSNFTVTGDTLAPTANFTAATDDAGTITGTLNSGDTTDDTALVLSGTNENGATVNVYNGGALLGAATVSGTGWSYSATIANGTTYQFNVRETDAAGNAGAATSNFTVIGDTVAPTANFTAATDDAGTVTGALSSGDTTDDTALVLSGTNESGATVNVYNGVTLLGSATVSGTSWSYSATIVNGTTYQFNVRETDTVGNTSVATSSFTVIGDTAAPTANLSAVTDNVGTVTGTLSSGDTTDDTALVLSGTNENDATVNVYNGGALLGAATVSGTGWSYSATVANGTTYQFNVRETDVAGNASAATSNFTVTGDMVAPTANFTAATDDAGTVTGTLNSGDTTDDSALLLSGTNENGATVNVYNGVALLGAATISGTSWSYSAAIANGTTYQFNVQETDTAGNTSAATSNFTVIGDTAAPTANLLAATDDVGPVTGALSSGDTTDDTALALTGTNENGSSVNVYDGVVLLGAATVSGTSWSYTATVANGTTYQFNITETDTVGNTSAATSNFTVIGDSAAPTLSPVIISSNNSSPAIAQVGNVITLSFVSSESLGSLPITTIAGNAVTVTNTSGNNYEASYTMIATDVIGAGVTFTVNFIDSTGNAGVQVTTVTSGTGVTFANTIPVNTIQPVISGSAIVGNPLSATDGSWTDANNDTLSFSYQWKSDGSNIIGATASSYTLTEAEAHKAITVEVTANDGNSGVVAATSATTSLSNNDPANTTVPMISGTSTVGNALITTNGAWSDVDGDTLSFSYQWYRSDDNAGLNEVVIAAATASSYTLITTDSHKYLRVIVTANDGNGSTDQSAVSSRIAITNSAPVNSVLPVISGTATVGNALTTTDGSWTDADGESPTYSYQWQANGIDISGATTNSFTLTTAEAHQAITVIVTAEDGNSGTTPVTSAATVVSNSVPVNTVLPVISGSAAVGSVLSSTNGSWTDADTDALSYSYQWKSNGINIAGATSSSYTLSNAELGDALTVTVTAIDGHSGITSVTSAATAIVDSDFDGDGIGDATDPDDDNDGMTDVFELANGLDPEDASDASTDLDGDGVSNLDEFTAGSDPALDDYAPVMTLPDDITVDATGLFTAVDIGNATAVDGLDGDLMPSVSEIVTNGASPKALIDNPTHFKPGINILTWSVTDLAGNAVTGTQTINVNPMVAFSKDQATSEGSSVSFRVILNGDAVTYPVTVPYTVGGIAATDGSDHDLVDGTVSIGSGTEAVVNFTTVDDGAGEGVENIMVTMGAPVNAVNGPNLTHNVDIYEGNVAPTIALYAEQGVASSTLTVVQDGGDVLVSSRLVDPNVADSHSYDWSGTDNSLVDTDSMDDSFTFDPSVLTPGLYNLRVIVSDGNEQDDAKMILKVVASAPVLTATDSDGDGVDDQSEGFGDSDGDGIADYLDAIAESNVLQEQIGVSTSYLVESEPGLSLTLSHIAFESGNDQAEVSMDDIVDVDGRGDDVERYTYPGGLFDFTVSDLPVAGQSVNIVLAQLAPIPAQAIYRKLSQAGWQDFVVDDNNSIYSAMGEAGFCPPPGDLAYQTGLTEGHWCVQLTIEDGGPNDSDNAINNSVVDPGGVAQILSEDVVVNVRSSGGAINLGWLALLGFVGVFRSRLLRTKGDDQ